MCSCVSEEGDGSFVSAYVTDSVTVLHTMPVNIQLCYAAPLH